MNERNSQTGAQSDPLAGTPVLEQACEWLIELNDGEADSRVRAEFTEWLRRSPEHVRAYMEIAAAWEDSARLRGKNTPDADGLVAQALAESNVVPLPRRAAAATSLPATPGTFRRFAWAAGLAAVVALGAVFGGRYLGGPPAYETAVGEQRTLTLADNSVVELNARSRIRVELTGTERVVELLEGQALFEVSKDPGRPFIVRSGSTQVRAVGTQFEVYRKTSSTVVTVIEGRVAVSSSSASGDVGSGRALPEPLLVSAGEQVVATVEAVATPKRTDVEAATAWRQRKLMFDNAPLNEVVAEFNRYSARRMVIEDPRLAEAHIRGTFPASDPTSFVELLKDRFGVEVRETPTEIRISAQ